MVSRSITTAVVLSLALSGAAGAQYGLPLAETPERVGLQSRTLDEVTTLLDRFVVERKVAGGVAAVARNGEVAYMRAVGYQNLDRGMPMTTSSIFRIYSMTKPVTAVAVMMLQEEGRLDLDDPVSAYLPEFARVVVEAGGEVRPPARPITVRDLLLHTSGLSHRTSPLYRDAAVRSRSDPLPRFIENIVAVPLMEDPGTRFRYSEATTVLGRLVEIWSGQAFDEFLHTRIFEPLGMGDTGFIVSEQDLDRLVTAYSPAQDAIGGLREIELEEVPFTQEPALLEGAVGLVSTVPDFLRFAQMLLNGGELDGVRILSAETVALMTRNGLTDEMVAARGGTYGWGLANVNVLVDPTRAAYPASAGEYGWDGSAGTIFWVEPEEQLAIVLMTQISPANPDRLRQQVRELVSRALID